MTGISALLVFLQPRLLIFRRTTELAAIAVAFGFTAGCGKCLNNEDKQAHMERMAERFTGGAMIFRRDPVNYHNIPHIFVSSGRNVTMGLVVAALGVLVNTWFWLRYRALNRENYDAVMAVQQKLYRAKACADICVVVALAAVAIAPGHPVTWYTDVIGSVIITFYLFWNGLRTVQK